VSDTRYIYTLRARHSDETLREADRNCLLLRAAAQGQLPRVQHLLRLGADVDFADDSGFTALHHAVSSGFEDCVQELIHKGADINSPTSFGVALNIAADKRRSRVAEILVRARADSDEAITFAEEGGVDVGVLKEFLTQALRSSGLEIPWTTCSGASNDGTPTDTHETGGDADVDEPSDGLRSTTPVLSSDEGINYYDKIADFFDSSAEQALPREGFFRRLIGTTKRERKTFDIAPIVRKGRGKHGLTTLYTPSHDHIAHIIFVHGQGGTSRETWTIRGKPSTFWPLEWLPSDIDFRHTKIHTFGYDAAYNQEPTLTTINDFAKSLLQCLDSHADLKDSDEVCSVILSSSDASLTVIAIAASVLCMS
jgi:hypothetical protein